MAIHKTYIPDCPQCGTELRQVYKSIGPFTEERPWGTRFEAWHDCPNCGFQTDHAVADHKDVAKKMALEKASAYLPID